MAAVAEREVLERLATDTPLYARELLWIVDKNGRRVKLIPNAAQLALDRVLEQQRTDGLPQRAVVLKARQVGISTWVQAKLIQRCTLRRNHSAICLAHDRETGAKFYRMGNRMYRGLPDEPGLKPPVLYHQRARFMHFAEEDDDGNLFPDSTYLVDTAGEQEAGHGGTNAAIHASELARWANPEEKLTALKSTVPRHSETLFVIESTAKGNNLFKDVWDDAVAGRSGYAPFFWPWWKHEEYSLAFVNEAEREGFRVGWGDYGEDERELVDPGPLDTLTGEHVPLTLEQLHWRRITIADECSGKIAVFKEQYPSTPEEAFVATGRRVFDSGLVGKLILATEQTDPLHPSEEKPGPTIGAFRPKRTKTQMGRLGPLEVPQDPIFKPPNVLKIEEDPNWKLWVEKPNPDTGYVIGCDVSGGFSESGGEEPAYHAIEVIDHGTGEQVAEYSSRCDPDLLGDEVYLAALYFNDAWVAIERTGSWGMPPLRKIALDYRYPFVYLSKKHDRRDETTDDRLGWDTNNATKPLLLSFGSELLREGTTGIKSRALAYEMQTYIRNEKGKTMPEPGKFSDRLLAWLIARQVALEKPMKPRRKGTGVIRTMTPRDGVTGY